MYTCCLFLVWESIYRSNTAISVCLYPVLTRVYEPVCVSYAESVLDMGAL